MSASDPVAAFFATPSVAAAPVSVAPASGAPATAARPFAPRDMLRKAELELAMLTRPDDGKLRASYFDLLFQLAGTQTGLLWASLPDLPAPLYFRAGTPDIAVLAQSFRDAAFAIDVRATPQHILVIGAYAGYLAVDLARRFPRAHLLCVEPLPENFRLLSLNTTPWRRIRVAQTALWHSATRLAPMFRTQADWAVRLTEEAPDSDRVIGSLAVAELLGRAGWHHAEMVVCDASGAEREIFSDPLAPWLRHVDVALVKLHESSAGGATAMVEACFDPAVFTRGKLADMEVFERRTPRMALPPGPPELHLIRNEPGVVPFALRNVIATGWAFFVFDGTSCQLHPNPPGQAPATVGFQVRLDGYSKFSSSLVHAGSPIAGPVRFSVTVQRPDGTVLERGETTVKAHDNGRLVLPLTPATGTAQVILQTAMAAGVPHNNMAWARWVDPKLS